MKSHLYIYIAAGAVALIALIVAAIVLKRRPKKLNTTQLGERWLALQKRCVDKNAWHQIVLEADKLLDDVLKRGKYKGKTTGERLVSAQHSLSSNDTVWFGHKLRNKIVEENLKQLSKQDTLEALSGFRQALKDLGALVDRRRPGLDDEGPEE